MPEFCSVEKDGHLTVITLQRPDVMNSLHPPANAELSSVYAAQLPPKRPDDKARVQTDWGPELDQWGGAIVGSTWATHPDNTLADLTLSQDVFYDRTASVLVEGGTDGIAYGLVNEITLDDGQVLTCTLSFAAADWRVTVTMP